MNRLLLTIIGLFTTALVFGQENDVEMADALYSSGKIYVVVTVVTIIFTVLFVYLVILDRKINKLKKGQ